MVFTRIEWNNIHKALRGVPSALGATQQLLAISVSILCPVFLHTYMPLASYILNIPYHH